MVIINYERRYRLYSIRIVNYYYDLCIKLCPHTTFSGKMFMMSGRGLTHFLIF